MLPAILGLHETPDSSYIRPVSATALLIGLLAALAWATDATAQQQKPDIWYANDGQVRLHDVPAIPDSLVDRMRQYQNVRSARLVDWSNDGDALYIRTRLGTSTQVHRVHAAGGTRRQITYFDEPIGRVARRPGGNQMAIQLDVDGTERDQLLLFNPSDASYRTLTEADSRNRKAVWSRDGLLMAFQSTRRSGDTSDLWIMRPDQQGSERLLLTAEPGTWWAPVDFSNNGRYLLVQEFRGVDDSRIYRLDLETEELMLVAGDSEFPSANRGVTMDRQNTGFYYITNALGLAAELAWRSFEPDSPPEYISASITWDVSEFALSKDGKRGAFAINEEGMSRLYLFDARSRRFSLIRNLPVGIIAGLKFSPDNRSLAFNFSTSKSPSDVYVLELGRRALRANTMQRWTFSEVGGLDTEKFIEPRLVRYPSFDLDRKEQQRKIPAFVYRPSGEGPHPVVIYVHGGPENQYRPSFSSLFQFWINELNTAVIAPNIRGSTGYDSTYLGLDDGLSREDAVKDIGALLDWIDTQEDLDGSRVAIYGGSYGGYVVLASAVHYSDRLRAGVDIVGISNFVTFLENTEEYRRDLRRAEYGDERDPEMRAFLQSISPLNNVDRIDIPLLVVQGTNDPRVPASESEQIVDALRARGQPVWYIEALNEGHGYLRKENRDLHEQATVLFLQRYLLNRQ